MRVGIVTAPILLSSFDAAVAQGVQDDPRRRRLVLPSVREATDCIARETLNEPGVEGATRTSQFRAALAQPMRRCADEVDAMIAAHDQVYYPGYGEAFFQGPYLQDLVRAIQKRIGPELARRASEVAERAAIAQQPNAGFQVAQPAQKPFDQNAEQAKREADEREKREVDAMWQRIRLFGIDAPESAQVCGDAAGKEYRCGQVAALALSDRISEGPISCEPRDTDRYCRTIAVCRKGPEDLNASMLAQGHAVAFRRYSSEYVGYEAQARAAKRRIWAGTFEDPAGWRRTRRGGADARAADEPTPAGSNASMTCTIKGNISAKDDRIYHLPGTSAYTRTVIDERAGERMFCTEDEAKAAGWRAPRS